jgi:NAD-dependent DNA ligase
MEKKKKTRKLKEFIILEESPKNKTLKLSSLSASIKRKNCKKGTKKYKPLGTGCYSDQEIELYKSKVKLTKMTKQKEEKEKKEKSKTKTKTKKVKDKKVLEFEIINENPIIIEKPPSLKNIIEKNSSPEISIKIPEEIEIMEKTINFNPVKKRYNEEFIDLMEKLSSIMLKQGEPFRARAYQKAQETIMNFPDDIISPEQLKGQPGIGPTIMEKLKEYVETGTLRVLEREKTNPINILGDVYGIGPKKAKELVDKGIKTIDELRSRQDELLNDIQKIGLKYYEQIQERIPRKEIEEFDKILKTNFENVSKNNPDDKLEIVGSFRRGAESSGDIDVIITGKTGEIYKKFIDELLKSGIILHVLSRGPSKTLVIAKLPGSNKIARRVDFLYTPPDEFPFAILYFTGSKIFNTVMRQEGLNKGYTFNEHGIYKLENKKKGEKINKEFKTEKDIFDFLGLQYKTPLERKDGRAVRAYMDVEEKPLVDKIMPPTSMKGNEPDVGAVLQGNLEVVPTSMKAPFVAKNKTLKKKTKDSNLKHLSESEIVQIVDNFRKNGISIIEPLSEGFLTDIIRFSIKKYHNEEPIMSDNQYDIIKEFTEKKYPDHPVFTEIGAEVERNKAKLPYEMGSMDKIKPDTNALQNWSNKYKGPYVLSCKLDGVSGLYTTEGSKPKLYTRGNGKIGQDVSHLIPFLRLPKNKGIVIRGEFIIPKTVFQDKYKTKFANPRNMVAGICNHKTISDAVVDLHFVAYEVIMPSKIPSQQMEFLGTLNVERVLYKIAANLSNEMLSNLLKEWRQDYMYEIDGVIVVDDHNYSRKSGNPDHAFAFKMILSDQIAEAKVVDVIWTPSKDGYLKPRVRIEPMNLGGVTIEYATGFNAAFIKDNNIGIGATIELIRSGDVIPHIKSVTQPAESPKMPSVPYKWNDTHVDIMLENAFEDPTVKEKNITGFFRGIGVEGLSSGNIARIIKAGYDSVPKIIKMTENELLTVEGFKGKMASKIYNGIHDKINEASIITLMAASNIFGRGFSEKKIELVLNQLPDILTSNESKNNKIAEVAGVKGMAVKTAEAFVDKIENFKAFLKECNLENKLYLKPQKIAVDQSHPLFNKSIVLTGTRDKDIIEFLKKIGATQGANVSKNTFLVVAPSKEEDTGKAEEARKLNIPIVSVDEFKEKYITIK